MNCRIGWGRVSQFRRSLCPWVINSKKVRLLPTKHIYLWLSYQKKIHFYGVWSIINWGRWVSLNVMYFYIFYQNIRILLGQVKGLQIWSIPSQMPFDCPAKSSNLSSPNFICQECKFVWYACRKHLQKYLKCIFKLWSKSCYIKENKYCISWGSFRMQQVRQNFDYRLLADASTFSLTFIQSD